MYTIREVCRLLDVPPHVLRYWERVIPLVAPRKDSYGRRVYTGAELNQLARVRYLVREKGLSPRAAGRQLWRDTEAAPATLRSLVAEARAELLRARAVITRKRKGETGMDPSLRERLRALGQAHVLAAWEKGGEAARQRLEADLAAADLGIVERFAELVGSPGAPTSGLAPAPYVSVTARDPDLRALGMEAARAGRCGAITVAGGQGSRLGFEGPKGVLPITPIRGASLFQVLAEKLLGFSRDTGARIPWYIMTSPENHEATVSYFRERSFFGLPEEDVVFFPQGTLASLDLEGRLLLAPGGGLVKNPDGHGGLVAALARHRVFEHMRSRGVEHLFYFQVDNPLVEVPDPLFLGHHLSRGADVSAKVIPKRSPDEKLGVIALRDGRPCIVEYSDLDEASMNARDASGRLLFEQGSIAIHIFRAEFLAAQRADLPLHVARKKVRALDPATGAVREMDAVKFERFIFDLLPLAGTVLFYETIREQEFSPVKNREGLDSPETCRRDQVEKAARMLEACGIAVPRDSSGRSRHVLEISPLYAWDSECLKRRLAGADIRIEGDRLFAV